MPSSASSMSRVSAADRVAAGDAVAVMQPTCGRRHRRFHHPCISSALTAQESSRHGAASLGEPLRSAPRLARITVRQNSYIPPNTLGGFIGYPAQVYQIPLGGLFGYRLGVYGKRWTWPILPDLPACFG